MALHSSALSEVERLTRGEMLQRPVPARDARGRLTRDPRGELDWYYALPDSERAFIARRFFVVNGTSVDVVATMAGYPSVDDRADDFVAAVRGARDVRSRERESVEVWELVSVGEIATALGVVPSAVSNWRNRPGSRMPLPLAVLSCGPIWKWDEVRQWAEETGRLVFAEEETF